MDVYIVTREGVYRHEIVGVFIDYEKAVECCVAVANFVENDNWHTIIINKAPLNKYIEDVVPIIGKKHTKAFINFNDITIEAKQLTRKIKIPRL